MKAYDSFDDWNKIDIYNPKRFIFSSFNE
jgi:hypothetical protein